ncbi:DUF167 domain-containing protein [Candidatus Saccharibacteria bacterium]|nr:DUF167 domain-containing protein [Candidatus Saccharibacteria bacterium]MBQ3264049.1 DUF167 domain-containing protein [Candidatus Saccharibacteria bacterium]
MPTYQATVKPGSSQQKITETTPGNLTIFLRAKPHDGEANEALINLLSKHFKVPKTSIRISRGAHSRHKTITF